LSLRRKRCQAAFLAGLMVFALAIAGASMVIPAQGDGTRFSFTLMTNQGNQARITSAEIVKENLEDIGIQVNLQIVEWPTFVYENLLGQDFDAIIVGWIYGNDPDMSGLFHSDYTNLFEYNFVGYNNSYVDDLLIKAQGEPNVTLRQEMYFELQEIFADEVPYDFLVYPQQIVALGNGWSGFIPGPHAGGPIGWWSIANVTDNDGSDTLIEASIGAASNLNPIILADDASGGVSEPMYPSLISVDNQVVPYGDLAASWTYGKTWFYYQLRDDYEWTDGITVNATDYLFTYGLLLHANDPDSISESPYSYVAAWIDEIQVPSEFEVNVTVDTSVYPNGYAPGWSDLGSDIIPEHIFNSTEHSDWESWAEVKAGLKAIFADADGNVTRNKVEYTWDDWWNLKGGDGSEYWYYRWLEDSVNNDPQNTASDVVDPVTCGFWKFSSWNKDLDEVTLVRNDDYPLWSEAKNKNAIGTYIYKKGGTMDEISLSLQNGEIDLQEGPNPAYVETLQDDPNVQVLFADQLAYTYMGFNLRRAPFDDVNVRRAICWAVDKQAIYDAAYYGYGDIGTGPVYKALGQWYNPDVEDYTPPNPDLAEELLDNAGWPRAEEGGTDWAQIGLIAGIAAAAVIAIVVIYMVKIKEAE